MSFFGFRALVQRRLSSPLQQEQLEYLQHCANQGYGLKPAKSWSEDKGLVNF
jgi:hypothetical protein